MTQSTTLVGWKPELSVKNDKIDSQHKRLFDLLDNFYKSFVKKEHEDKIGEILQELKKYTIYHFDTEERAFQKYSFPNINTHLQKHSEFRNKISELIKKYETDKTAITYELMSFIRKWLVEHIEFTDKADFDYLQKTYPDLKF